MRVLITGCAGFIGMHVSSRLLAEAEEVIGVDNLNDYYDPALKRARLSLLQAKENFTFLKGDISDSSWVRHLFEEHRPDFVVHLAAQAGVRYSLTHPDAYVQSNVVGFANILEGCRLAKIKHLVYASSSSVYGANESVPFSTTDRVDRPISLYAATKKANELFAYSYSHLYGIPSTGLRYFSAYGPWGRPDMAPWLFTRAILKGETIELFNHGKMKRDFIYIDDLVECTLRVLRKTPLESPPYKVFNVGGRRPVELIDFVKALEEAVGRTATIECLPLQKGDLVETVADIAELEREIGFSPVIELPEGLARWFAWFKDYSGR